MLSQKIQQKKKDEKNQNHKKFQLDRFKKTLAIIKEKNNLRKTTQQKCISRSIGSRKKNSSNYDISESDFVFDMEDVLFQTFSLTCSSISKHIIDIFSCITEVLKL